MEQSTCGNIDACEVKDEKKEPHSVVSSDSDDLEQSMASTSFSPSCTIPSSIKLYPNQQ